MISLTENIFQFFHFTFLDLESWGGERKYIYDVRVNLIITV